MEKLIFTLKADANEYAKFMKEKGHKVSAPVKEKYPTHLPPARDLDGKPLKYRWVVKHVLGAGYEGGKKDDDDSPMTKAEWAKEFALREGYEEASKEENLRRAARASEKEERAYRRRKTEKN